MNNTRKKYRHEFIWAIRLSIMSAVWLLIQYFTGLHSQNIEWHPTLGFFWYIFAFLLLHYSLIDLKAKEGGLLAFWQGVQSVTLIAVMSVPLHLILNSIYYSTMGSVFFESAIIYSVEMGWEADEVLQYFSLSALLIRESLGIISSGFIISLISSVFLKNQ